MSASPPPSEPAAGAAVGAAPATGAAGGSPSVSAPPGGATTETPGFDGWGQRLTLARGPLFAFFFFGMLGGLKIYGVLGLFLGPVLLSIVVAFVKIYQEQYAGSEPGAAATRLAGSPGPHS